MKYKGYKFWSKRNKDLGGWRGYATKLNKNSNYGYMWTHGYFLTRSDAYKFIKRRIDNALLNIPCKIVEFQKIGNYRRAVCAVCDIDE